jgi:SOS-response transcriptional repressor LexA
MFPVLRHLWGPDRYCLKLEFDSMEPTLKPGDIVLVHYRPDVNPEHVQGRICACLVDGQPTLKRVSVEQHGPNRLVVLRGDNPGVSPIVVDLSHQEFSIQGVAVCLVSRNL